MNVWVQGIIGIVLMVGSFMLISHEIKSDRLFKAMVAVFFLTVLLAGGMVQDSFHRLFG